MMCRRSAGFTLIELLVAMSIFAMVALMAYSGLDIVMKARKQGDAHAVKLAALQTAFAILERDIEQAVNRSIRDDFGDARPPMEGDDERLEFSRTGRRNPGGFSRSHLHRIAYSLEDEQLMRASWQVMDRAQDSVAASGPLFEGIESIKFSYLDTQLEWQSTWPAAQNPAQATSSPVGLPRAIELIIESEQWGEIRRVFRVAGGEPVAQSAGGS